MREVVGVGVGWGGVDAWRERPVVVLIFNSINSAKSRDRKVYYSVCF